MLGIFSRLPEGVATISSISRRMSSASKGDRGAAACRSSTNSPAKLSTKFNRFLISCAIPAVYCPRDVLFSVWIRLGCAASNSRNSASVVSRAETGRA
jgi:hypothetical protein